MQSLSKVVTESEILEQHVRVTKFGYMVLEHNKKKFQAQRSNLMTARLSLAAITVMFIIADLKGFIIATVIIWALQALEYILTSLARLNRAKRLIELQDEIDSWNKRILYNLEKAKPKHAIIN